MVRRLPSDIDREILNQLIQGSSYRATGRRFGVSIASVARVAEDERGRTPDFDSLRAVAVLLNKEELTVFDVERAHRLLENLGKWGLGVDEICDYVELNQRFLLSRSLDEDFVFYAVKLLRLEKTSGRSYEELMEDCDRKMADAVEAEQKKTALDSESLVVTVELRKAKTDLEETKMEIEKAVASRRGLRELGLNKVAQLVQFFQDFQSMRFNADEVKRLAVWRRELEELHIMPDALREFITDRGPLEAQNENLRLANKRIEAEVNTQEIHRVTLLEGNSALRAVDEILRTGTMNVLCKSCSYPLPTALLTKELLLDLMRTGKVLILDCPKCGLRRMFGPWDIALQIAWIILPTDKRVTVSI